ncbi:MAG: SET domain-containing protein [Myxococcota bacterium]|nr:SET domain-containing protein [Myxococcota bacterium]
MLNADSIVHHCKSRIVAVASDKGHYRIVATEDIAEGRNILTIEGQVTQQPTMYSVQISEHEHIDLDDPFQVEQHPERYMWRFLNHHCRPNSVLEGRELRAIKTINAGDEVTFNYNANEYEMASPFSCWCESTDKAARCTVRGYKYLSSAERRQLDGLVSPHVLTLANLER